jgi:DNA-binding MarR family transcriptional regulator
MNRRTDTSDLLARGLSALSFRSDLAPESEQTSPDSDAFERYFGGIASAHFVIRKVFRIADDQARKAGLDPLEHKLLIQIFGSEHTPLRVNEAAARIDIAPALASRLVRGLEEKGLVVRSPNESDRRITQVTATTQGRILLRDIDRGVRMHVDYFQSQLTDSERAAAIEIFAFYLGARPTA